MADIRDLVTHPSFEREIQEDWAFARVPIVAEIAKERRRQIEHEGYSTDHDDLHDRGELALAAASYAIEAVRIAQVNPPHHLARLAHECWPFRQSAHWPKPQRRLLVIAAALLVAEIERLDRVDPGQPLPSEGRLL